MILWVDFLGFFLLFILYFLFKFLSNKLKKKFSSDHSILYKSYGVFRRIVLTLACFFFLSGLFPQILPLNFVTVIPAYRCRPFSQIQDVKISKPEDPRSESTKTSSPTHSTTLEVAWSTFPSASSISTWSIYSSWIKSTGKRSS